MLMPRQRLFGVPIAALRRTEAVELLDGWLSHAQRAGRIVVTPNVHHVVRLDGSADFRRAYQAASLVLADGWPLVAVSRLVGAPLPERVTGSDLVPALFEHVDQCWHRPLRVFLLGAAPGVAQRAAERIESRWPRVRVVGTAAPAPGFADSPEACQRLRAQIMAARAELLVIGFGAPVQEQWAAREAEQLDIKVAVCAGATIDFLAGEKSRAPAWMQRSGLEWLHRVVTEPRRLSRRYAHDALRFPRLVWREWRRHRGR